MHNNAIDIRDFKKTKTIGRGASCHVDLVKEIKTGKQYAMKYICKNKKISMQEINSYMKINNPVFLKYYGYDFSKPNTNALLLEYMPNGSLESVLQKCRNKKPPPNFTLSKKYIILKGIAYGMNYLHSQSIVHRDLKTGNILLDENFYPRICDFGISYVSEFPDSKYRIDDISDGAPLYKSPETINYQTYSYKTDVYSYSLIAYELITGKKPFKNYTKQQIYKNVKQGIRPDVSELNIYFQEFFFNCWSDDPKIRPTFYDIINMLQMDGIYDSFQVDEKDLYNYEKRFYDYQRVEKYINNFDINKSIIERDHLHLYAYGRGLLMRDSSNIEKALKYIKIAADIGSVDAMHFYPILLKKCEDQTKNDEIVKYHKMAADKGNIFSMIEYSCCAFKGEGMPVNKREGYKYIKKAADCGDKYSMYKCGLCLLFGIGCKKNYEKTAKYFKKAADLFHVDSMNEYGEMLINGVGVKMDKEEGMKYLKRSADNGNVGAMISYAEYSHDIKEAAKYYKMAANQGCEFSAFNYARLLYNGKPTPQDKLEAQRYFKIGGDNGSLISMFYYSLTLLNGLENKKVSKLQYLRGIVYLKILIDCEFEPAIKFFWLNLFHFKYVQHIKENKRKHKELACKEKDDDGVDEEKYICFYYSFLIQNYMSEKEIDEYTQKSLNYFEKKADENDICITLYYIDILHQGLGIPRNDVKAIYYLKKLILLGNTESMVKYGVMLRYGFGLLKNTIKAFEYFKMAALKGDQEGLYFYKDILYRGELFKYNFHNGLFLDSYDLYFLNDNRHRLQWYISHFMKENCLYDMIDISLAKEINESNSFLDIFGSGCDSGSDDLDLKNDEIIKDSLSKFNFRLGIQRFFELLEDNVENIKKAAEDGDIESNLRYGEILLNGEGVPPDKNEALRYFKYAADRGNAKAMFYYGKFEYEKEYKTGMEGNGLSYIRNAAKLGETEAMSYLGLLIITNKITATEEDDIVKYFQKAAEKEDPISMLHYGNMLLEGKIVTKDVEKGINYIKQSADFGNETASLKYGLILYEGVEIPADKEKAILYIKKSADQGNKDAIARYIQILKNEDGIINKKQLSIYLKMMADLGDVESMLEYGKILLEDVNNEKRYDNCDKGYEAYEYFKNAADLNNIEGMLQCAKLLFSGELIPMNTTEGAKFIKKAADLGCPDAITNYSRLLLLGNGVDRDVDKALQYLKKSLEFNNSLRLRIYNAVFENYGLEPEYCEIELEDYELDEILIVELGLEDFLDFEDYELEYEYLEDEFYDI